MRGYRTCIALIWLFFCSGQPDRSMHVLFIIESSNCNSYNEGPAYFLSPNFKFKTLCLLACLLTPLLRGDSGVAELAELAEVRDGARYMSKYQGTKIVDT